MVYLYLFLAWYLVSGVLTYGITLGYFQSKYPKVRDKAEDTFVAIIFGIFGFISVFIVFFMSNFVKFGFKFKAEGPDENAPYSWELD